MPFRSIVATPEELAGIVAAFEEAWSKIDARNSIDPVSVPAQRERLGYIIAGLWAAGQTTDLTEVAVRRFEETAVASKALGHRAERQKISDK
ncbi:hypothetical protein AB4099_27065 [Bosea sp. 2KB_26]|uniref:hypothetical protein n=1 Tax=Bosea sp. 2KB_26 TaxID=3237475 RepID=UPI003F8E8358